MKKILLYLLCLSTLSGCTTVKSTTARLNSGNYDEAIRIALNKLKKNPDKKGKQEYVLLLEEAFTKAKKRDIERVAFLEKQKQTSNLERIYNTYVSLRKRQDIIKPILPLRIFQENRTANFQFENYDDEIIQSKNELVASLYTEATTQFTNASSKEDYRNVHKALTYLDKLKPGYKNTATMLTQAHEEGTAYISVLLSNDSDVALPNRLQNELMDFSTLDLDDFWTVYHSRPSASIEYNYEIQIAFTDIVVSPESVKERELQKEKLIKDGSKFLRDDEGDFVYGEDGEKIEVDNMITVRSTYHEYNQFKAVNVSGRVRYLDLTSNQIMDTFPLASEFVFEHNYATFSGDRRALEDALYKRTRVKAVPFPSNEQMIYDAGEDLKLRIKEIISSNSF